MAESDARANQKHVIFFIWPYRESPKDVGEKFGRFVILKESSVVGAKQALQKKRHGVMKDPLRLRHFSFGKKK